MRSPSPLRSASAAALLALLVLGAGGCFNPFRPLISEGTVTIKKPPVPSTSIKVVELFKWCWENRDIASYREIFTDDYRFAFAITDSAGNLYRNTPWTREDELVSAQNLFVGGSASEPAASSITLIFNGDLFSERDFRPGKMFPWHQQIQVTNLTLTVNKSDGSALRVTGQALFFLVRGDSAVIPKELVDRGFRPDSTRWYIERWEDQTNTGGPSPNSVLPALPASASAPGGPAGIETGLLRALPPAGTRPAAITDLPTPMSWGMLKLIYRMP